MIEFPPPVLPGGGKESLRGLLNLWNLIIYAPLLSNFPLADVGDAWDSKPNSNGDFYVNNLRCLIDSKLTCVVSNPTSWLTVVPLKVTCFIWRACLDRIPTAIALMHRGVNIPSDSCHLCPGGTDSSDHILYGCPFTREVLLWIFKWCGIPLPVFDSVTEVIAFAANWGRCPKKKMIFVAIVYCLLWNVWKVRNDELFNNVHYSPSKTTDIIISMVYNWITCGVNLVFVVGRIFFMFFFIKSPFKK